MKRTKRQWASQTANRRVWLNEAKDAPCADCHKSFDPICMDFHHLNPKTKKFNISQSNAWPWADVLAEIDKCVLLCSNCHRLRTKYRRDYEN